MRSSSSPAKRRIQVFIASPGDVPEERRAFKEIIDELNKGFGRGANIEFLPLGWEDALAQVGRRSQSVINQDVDACDLFILVMWRRWGQEAPDAAPYTSYTEEEFYRALTRFEKEGSPEVFVFFKHIDPGQMADPGPQLTKVLEFRKKLEETRQVLYRGFKTVEEFKKEIDTHLVAYAKGDFARLAGAARAPLLPDSVAAEVEKHKGEAQRAVAEMEKLKAEMQRTMEEAEKARAEAKDALARAEAAESVAEAKAARRSVELAEQAAKAALEGKIEEARQGFAKALDGTTNLGVLFLGFQFFQRIGELDEAERLARRRLAICGPDAQTASTAAAYISLGSIYYQRGDLDQAEEMNKKALAINETLGWPEGLVDGYSSLGLIYYERGDLDQAEEMHKKALAINETLGLSEGLSGDYTNLGLIYYERGDLDQAEEMHKKALAIDETLGLSEGLAKDYTNLGVIYYERGHLSKAEKMYRKTLKEAQRVGAKAPIAHAWHNLGTVAHRRGQMEKARDCWTQAAALYGQMGMSKDRDACVALLAQLKHPKA